MNIKVYYTFDEILHRISNEICTAAEGDDPYCCDGLCDVRIIDHK